MSLGNKLTAGAVGAAIVIGGAYYGYISGQEDNQDIDLPNVEIPVVDIPKVEAKIKIPQFSKPISSRAVSTKKIRLKKIETDNRVFMESRDRLAASIKFEKGRKQFKDQRNLSYELQNVQKIGTLKAWRKIYASKATYKMEFIPVRQNIKMVAEVHHPIDMNILKRNINFYKKRGYNAILITFGYNTETMAQLVEIAKLVKNKGLEPWMAYSGPESLTHNVFYYPESLKSDLQILAKVCSGFIVGWRRTSSHLFEQDPGFTNFMISSVREANPKIQILGEAYYGQTASSNGNVNNLRYNLPKNCSGVLITGLGYKKVVPELVLNNLLVKIKNVPKLVLIVGEKPYYMTKFNNKKSWRENLEIKENIGDIWKKEKVCGVVILHGDGSDGLYNSTITDNLGTMEAKMKK